MTRSERAAVGRTRNNRAITEGRRRFLSAFEEIESGAECERFAPIVEALGNRSASAAQVLQIRPHLRHCTACRAAVRELHLSRLRRASLFWPVFVIAEPLGRLPTLKHDAAALFHRAQASDLATGAGVAGSGGGGRIATVGAVLGLCLGGASVGTVCVVTDRVPILGADPPARQAARAEQPKPKMAKRSAEPADRCFPWRQPRPAHDHGRARPNPSPRPRKPGEGKAAESKAVRLPIEQARVSGSRANRVRLRATDARPGAGRHHDYPIRRGATAAASTDAKRAPAIRRHANRFLVSEVQPRRAGVFPVITSAESLRYAPRLLATGFLDARGHAAVRETRVLSARCARRGNAQQLRTKRGRRRVRGGELRRRPAELQHPRVHSLRDSSHADQARV